MQMLAAIRKWMPPSNSLGSRSLCFSETFSTIEVDMDTKKKILLVEDDVALAAVYRSRLELEDFDIREVNNGEDALSAAIEYKPDLILLDAMMPKISGFDVLDILRNTPDTANIRIIMLTALSQPKDKERAESLGVDDYLVKSQVVIGDVVERVKHHLGIAA
jgi:DNA-binding response OmpR family regulator